MKQSNVHEAQICSTETDTLGILSAHHPIEFTTYQPISKCKKSPISTKFLWLKIIL